MTHKEELIRKVKDKVSWYRNRLNEEGVLVYDDHRFVPFNESTENMLMDILDGTREVFRIYYDAHHNRKGNGEVIVCSWDVVDYFYDTKAASTTVSDNTPVSM
jgi:hypothetical protein